MGSLAGLVVLFLWVAPGCGSDDKAGNGNNSRDDTGSQSDADADADVDADADADADVDADTGDTGDNQGDDTGDDTDIAEDDRRTELLECVVTEGGCDTILEPNEDDEIFLQGPGYWLDDGLDHTGQTVCIPSGTYRHLNFSGLQGAEGNPVTITNCGAGQVVVDATALSATMTAHGSRYLRFTGTGDPDQDLGFQLMNPGAGRMVIDMQQGVSDIEIEYFEVAGPAYAGIAIRTYPYCDAEFGRDVFTQYNTLIHHNHVHDVGGEGLYIGPSHYFLEHSPTSDESCAPGIPEAALRGVEVHHNTIEDVGRDGIQVGAAIEGMRIHNNVVRRYGLSGDYGHTGGIQINPGSVGRVFSNHIESVSGGTTDNAIQFAGGEDGPTYLYNNLIVGTKTAFIALSRMGNADSPVHFLNNTVLNSHAEGSHTMTLFCSETWVQDFTFKNNIFANYDLVGSYIYTSSTGEIWTALVGGGSASSCPINGRVHENDLDENQKIAGNLYVQDPTEVGFVDVVTGDYHLDSTSPAIGTGENLGDIFTEDFEGHERGDGAFDMGAYKY